MKQLMILCAVVACVGLVACGSSGSAPNSIAGTWAFQILNAGECDVMTGTLDNNGGFAAQFFDVSQTGRNVSASFVDDGGSLCSLSGTYDGDQFVGQLEVAEQFTGGRVVRGHVEGFARVRNGVRQVDGWARIDFDSAGQCVGDVIEFCAIIDGDPPPPDDGGIIQQCPPVDIVFIMDTSGSMDDEAEALCAAIGGVEQQLRNLGLEQIRTVVLGITETATITETGGTADPVFDCLTNTVYRVAGGNGTTHPQVPGNPWPRTTYERDADNVTTIKPFELDPFDNESEEFWAPATALIAANYAWLAPATGEPPTVRIIVPISDESPQTGRDSCWTVDEAAIDNAARVAVQNGVRVSPILGTADGSFRDPCIADLARRLATRTGGTFAQTNPSATQGDSGADAIAAQLSQFIFDIVVAACEGRSTTVPLPPLPAEPPQFTGDDTLIGFNEDGEIYVVDRNTGRVFAGLDDEEDTGISGPVSSAIWIASLNQLWFGTGGESSDNGMLFRYDFASRLGVLLADNTAITSAHPGLTIDAAGAIFGTGSSNRGLLTIASNGSATELGGPGPTGPGKGITDADGILVTSRGDAVYNVDKTTGAHTFQGTFNLSGLSLVVGTSATAGYSVTAMTTEPGTDDVVYATIQINGGEGGFPGDPTYLGLLNPFSRNLQALGPMENEDGEQINLDGLTFVPTSFINGQFVHSPKLFSNE